MKKIFRMLVFSGLALYFTSLWDKGFVIPYDLLTILKLSILIAILHYLITPLARLILLPFNLLTLGLLSVIVYFLLFFFFVQSIHLITIKAWVWNGFHINYLINLVLSSVSISVIISLLEHIL